MSYDYDKDEITALGAITEAQKIAFAPMLFQAALNLRDLGILTFLDERGKQGASVEEVSEACHLSDYSVRLLLDVGLSGQILYQRESNFYLGKIGYYLLHDQMTRVNMDFTQDVCYEGLFHLKESLQQEKPAGLKVFGDWSTIYPGLSQLPEKAKSSWFAFDHFYSDNAFRQTLEAIFSLKPKHIYDVGGNTGKWALQCCAYDADVNVTILDLPQQVVLAKENIAQKKLTERIDTFAVDLLTAQDLPSGADLWWMSQFLDCFSETQIVHILSLVHQSMQVDARLCILEMFWDKQPFEAGAFSLNTSSLYFTCLANGNSRFYHSDIFLSYLEKAGFKLEQQIDGLGIGHSLLICCK